jgi:hypothetical protein
MKTLSRISLIATLAIAAAMGSGIASAANVSVGIYAGAPAPYYAPPPVVYAPRPYYAPPPVVYYGEPRWEHTDWRARREWRERQWRRDHWNHGHGHGHDHH